MKSSAVLLSSSLVSLSCAPGSLCSIAQAISINENRFIAKKILRAVGTPELFENGIYQYSIPTGFSGNILISRRDKMSVELRHKIHRRAVSTQQTLVYHNNDLYHDN